MFFFGVWVKVVVVGRGSTACAGAGQASLKRCACQEIWKLLRVISVTLVAAWTLF